MRKPFKRAELFLSVSMLCAACGVHASAHVQGASVDTGPSSQGSQAEKTKNTAKSDELEEVIVTGTSIRGAPPVGSNVITEHRVTHPEIAVNGDEATGTWYLQDRVIVAEFDFMLIGAGFYHDRYRRTADGWRISATGYDRTYDATMSLKNLDFKITPGIALA